jgi:hypothetical protein
MAADRMRAVPLIMILAISEKVVSGLATDVTLQNFERSRRLLRTRESN